MAQTPVGERLDQLGVAVDLEDGALVASAVVVLTYYAPDDSRPHLALAVSDGLGWIEQAGMLNNQLSKRPYLDLGRDAVIAQTASQSFDISVWQFFAAPLFGAQVDIVPSAIAA